MAHPLTDEICRQIAPFSELWSPTVECNDMRAAADWQLEQVIQAWEQCMVGPTSDMQVILLFDQKLKAMRPQENN